MRTIFIGDVHGCYKELKILLKEVSFEKEKDRLIFVGDLINKGPASIEVLDYVITNKFECILGNHEWGFLKALENKVYRRKRFETLYEEMGKKRDTYIEWMKNLPLFIEDKHFICIHGGLEPNIPLNKQRPEIATRIRTWGGDEEDMDNPADPPWYEFYHGEKPVIFGHWAMKGSVLRENAIGIDTGCVWGGRLTAFILEENEIVQVPALKQYRAP